MTLNNGTAWALGISGIVLFVMLGSSIAHAKKLGHLNDSFWYFSVVVLLTNASGVVSQYNGGRLDIQTAAGQSIVIMPGPAAFVASLVVPGMVVVSFAYFLYRALKSTLLNPAAMCYLLVLIFAGMGSLSSGYAFLEGSKFALFIAAAALVFAPRSLGGLRGAAHALAALVALSAVLALVDPTAAADVCDDRKCGLFGSLYNGVSFNFNGFGMLMAVAAPVMYFGLGRFGLVFAAAAAFFACASGSRTSQIAVLSVFLLILIFEYFKRRNLKAPAALPVIAATSAASAMVALPLIGLPGEAFTGRVELWNGALQRLQSSPLVGFGPDAWGSLQQIGVISRAASYATHNQLVETLYVSGFFGLIAMAGVGVFVARANRGYVGQLAIIMFPIFMIGATERPWSLGPPDWLSWSLLLIICTGICDVSGKVNERQPAFVSEKRTNSRQYLSGPNLDARYSDSIACKVHSANSDHRQDVGKALHVRPAARS